MKFLDDEIVKLTSNMINYVKGFFETPAYLDGEDFEIEIAELEKNQNKNRYIDIMPYDKTRVILKGKYDTETQFLMIAYPEGWFGLTVQTSVDFSWWITYPE